MSNADKHKKTIKIGGLSENSKTWAEKKQEMQKKNQKQQVKKFQNKRDEECYQQ